MLKHRNRAVTVEDFENLAFQAFRGIAKVKCLSDTNDQGQFETGWVTVLIVPESNELPPKPSVQLKRLVEKYLRDRAANVLLCPNHIIVTGPVYVEVSVHATLLATAMDVVPLVEQEAMKKLRDFLHPLTGGFTSRGWEFGSLPCISDFFALLEEIDGLDHVEKLTMTIQ